MMRKLLCAVEFWYVASLCQVDHLVPQIFQYSDGGFELWRFGERGGKRILEPGRELGRLFDEMIARFYGSLVAKKVLAVESKQSLQQKESHSCQTTGAVKNVSLGGELVCMEQGKFHMPQ